MIDALIGGTLHAAPEQRTSAGGKTYVLAKVRTPTAGGESLFVNVICFDRDTCAALLALGAGEPVHLAGALTPKAWTDREGNARPVLDMTASACLTAYAVKKRRDAGKAAEAKGGADCSPMRPIATASPRRASSAAPAGAGFDDMGDDL